MNFKKLSKYKVAFKISLQHLMAYRFNFIVSRITNVVVLLIFFYLWTALTQFQTTFAGYTREELITYVFGVNIIRALIFGVQTRRVAKEINQAELSNYLVRPINFTLFSFMREMAERFIAFLTAILEGIILILILKAEIIIQSNPTILIFTAFSIILAIFLYFVLSYLMSLLAFWSREAFGPRFLFEIGLEFSSGVFFPINILSAGFFAFLYALPFAYLIFFPLSIYLGRLDLWQILTGFCFQIFWLGLVSCLCIITWRKGLRKYAAEGG